MGDISGAYMIINLKNGKCYIGSSKNIEKRFRVHKKLLERDDHFNNYLQNSWNKYGKENFKFIVLEETKNKLEREQHYIDQYNSEYNILRDVEATPVQKGSGCREETIEKIVKNHADISGKNNPMYGKNKGKNNPFYGKHHTKKAKEKIGAAVHDYTEENNPMYGKTKKECPAYGRTGEDHPMYGKTGENHPWYGEEHTEEAKKKISKAHKDKKLSKETKQKMSEAHKGKEHSEETKQKMSEAHSGENNQGSKLTKSQVIEIKKRLKDGSKTYVEIAKDYPVESNAISSIDKGKAWSHINLQQ